jgi:aspartate aminotransferase-like enzyme
LNDAPDFPPERIGPLADRLARILNTRNDMLLFQTEAVVALEAVAASIARPGLTAINIVTTVRLPGAIAPEALLAAGAPLGMELSAGIGPGADRLVRLNHTGRRARFDIVLANVLAYGMALGKFGPSPDLGAAAKAVAAHYDEA